MKIIFESKKYRNCLFDIYNLLRTNWKYADKVSEDVYEEFWDILSKYNINIFEED